MNTGESAERTHTHAHTPTHEHTAPDTHTTCYTQQTRHQTLNVLKYTAENIQFLYLVV